MNIYLLLQVKYYEEWVNPIPHLDFIRKNCIFIFENKWFVQQPCDTNNRQTAVFSLNIDLLNIYKNSEKSLQTGKNPYIKAFLRGSYKDSPKRQAGGSNPLGNAKNSAGKPSKINSFRS